MVLLLRSIHTHSGTVRAKIFRQARIAALAQPPGAARNVTWDYQGKNGVYGDNGSSHYSGFPGIMAARNKSALEVFCAIDSGTTTFLEHNFGNEPGLDNRLSQNDILDLVQFITNTNTTSGLIDTGTYIDVTSKSSINSNNIAGEDLYTQANSCSQAGCHGNYGTAQATELGQLADEDPWKFMHRFRFGHPGNVAMPAYVSVPYSLTPADAVNILDYAQQSLINTTEGGSASTGAKASNILCRGAPVNLLNASAQRGGQLYDKWWITRGFNNSAPTTNQVLWNKQNTNTAVTTPDGSWRCKECHGWDYDGKDGAYGSGSHYTGFPGIRGAANNSADEVYCIIHSGTVDYPEHRFYSAGGFGPGLTDAEIVDLVKFIKETDGVTGLINTATYIDQSTKLPTAGNGNAPNGQNFYTSGLSCSNSVCHGTDGTLHPEDLGEMADANPWQFMHKFRFGHPGSFIMPAYAFQFPAYTPADATDVIAYAQQTLVNTTQGGSGPGPITGTPDANKMALGGMLYDNWPALISSPPAGTNPLWAFRPDTTTNTRLGVDTWRCKECHGWDYKGSNGAYATGSHYTGFYGIDNAVNLLETFISAQIDIGFNTGGQNVHNYGQYLSALQVDALVYFIKNGGVINTGDYIRPSSKTGSGDAIFGEDLYFTSATSTTAGCGQSQCHGSNGQARNFGTVVAPLYVGDLARDDPWAVLHKARFGQPGSNPTMPGMVQSNFTLQQAVDVLSFTQQLP